MLSPSTGVRGAREASQAFPTAMATAGTCCCQGWGTFTRVPPLERPGMLENLAQRRLWPGDLPVGATAPQSQKGPQEKVFPPALQGPPHLEGRLPRAQWGLQVLLVPWRHLTRGLGLGDLVLHVPAACGQGDQLIPDEARAFFTPSLPSPASPPPPLPHGSCTG